MEQLIAKDAILTILHKMAHAQDTLSRSQMLSCFHPTNAISFDVSAHLASYGTQSFLTPSELFDKTMGALCGFTATQHIVGNTIITFPQSNGDLTKAHAKAMALAYHCIETEDGTVESVTARAYWNIDLAVVDGKWVIVGIAITRDVPLDNPGLYGVAYERAEMGNGRKETVA